MPKSLIYIFLIYFCFNELLSSTIDNEINFKSVSDSSITIIFHNSGKSRLVFKEASQKSMTPSFKREYNNKNFIINVIKDSSYIFSFPSKKDYEISLKNLKSNTNYNFGIFFEDDNTKNIISKEIKHFTLDKEPNLQSSNIGFKKVTSSEIELNWVNGDGKGRIVFVRKGKAPESPKDGVEYFCSNDFKLVKDNIDGNDTKAVFITTIGHENFVTIKNLDFDKYYFQVYEFNGKGESINYLTKPSNSNPRFKQTLLSPPIANEATEIKNNGFMISWSDNIGFESYEIDLSKDNEFKNILELYNSTDVGKTNIFEISDLESGLTYYFRVKGVNKYHKSDYYNVIKIKLN